MKFLPTLGTVSALLSVVSTIMGNYCSQKETEAKIAKFVADEVAKQLAKKA